MTRREFFVEKVIPNVINNRIGNYDIYLRNQNVTDFRVNNDVLLEQLFNPNENFHIICSSNNSNVIVGLRVGFYDNDMNEPLTEYWKVFIDHINSIDRTRKINEFLI